jgi:hypothetical protein
MVGLFIYIFFTIIRNGICRVRLLVIVVFCIYISRNDPDPCSNPSDTKNVRYIHTPCLGTRTYVFRKVHIRLEIPGKLTYLIEKQQFTQSSFNKFRNGCLYLYFKS